MIMDVVFSDGDISTSGRTQTHSIYTGTGIPADGTGIRNTGASPIAAVKMSKGKMF